MKDGRQVIDIEDNDGHTALSYASQNGRQEEARVLWKHGADVNLCKQVNPAVYLPDKQYGKALGYLSYFLPKLIYKVQDIFQAVDFHEITMAPMVWYAARKAQMENESNRLPLASKPNEDKPQLKIQRAMRDLNDPEVVEDQRLAMFCAKYLEWLSQRAPSCLKSSVKEILRGVFTTLKKQYNLSKEDVRMFQKRPEGPFTMEVREILERMMAGSARVPRRGPALRL